MGWPKKQRESLLLVRPQMGVNFIVILFKLESLGGRDRERRIIGGDLVTTELIMLRVDKEVREILERVGKVTVNGIEFTILEQLIVEIFGLPMEGEAISREKTNQVGQLMKFIKDDETFCWLQSRITRESLPKPWDRVIIQIMKNPPLQVLVANLAKCSRRSSHLQKKLVEKPKVVDNVESTVEEKEDSDAGKTIDVGKSAKDVGPRILDKGPVKELDGNHNVVEDLKCHLKILNGLEGSLMSTCTCINLLALEITNYLKEVLINLKELSLTSNHPYSSNKNKEK
eukprot:Gb_34078 [translate_table: standard]